MTPEILCTHEGQIATVTLSNPDKLNAINGAMWRQLKAVMDTLSAQTDLRCIIIRGAGEVFAAGGDIEEFRTARATVDLALAYHEAVGAMWRQLKAVMDTLSAQTDLRCIIIRGAGEVFAAGGDIEEFRTARATVDLALAYHEAVGAALAAIEQCPLPTVAAIQGPCVGGGLEIACACDLRIAGTSAKFGAPILKLGFSMYPGEMNGLLQLAGPAVVKEILLEGRLFSAEEAFTKGLLSRVVADAQVMQEAAATAQRIVAGAPLVARWHKQWIARLLTGEPLCEQEKRDSFAFLASEDYAEGLAAFSEKRTPKFKGK